MPVQAQLRDIVRRSVPDRQRMLLSRLSLAAGLRPRLNRASAPLEFPEGRRAALVVSADLELAWAWRFARASDDPSALAHRKAVQGRRNMGPLLDLCDRFGVPVTWCTVGHLFLDHCDGSHPEIPRVPHLTNPLWRYDHGDWFDHDPGAADPSDPSWLDWHGPDLIRAILARPTAHEIGA